MQAFQFDAPELPAEAHAARQRVREFLAHERAAARYVAHRSSWMSFDAQFSLRAGAAGFIGMTWPREFGGHAQSSLVRFVVTEEMLAAGAPCGAHWIADRQSGPQILRHGSDRAKRDILPRICRGECLVMTEERTGYIVHFILIAGLIEGKRTSYTGWNIRQLMIGAHDRFGLPRHLAE